MIRINSPCITCPAKACMLINQLDKDQLANLQPLKHQLSFKKGEVIFNEGDPVTGVYFIQSGVVKHEITGVKGKPFILRLVGPGKPMGHRSLNPKSTQPYTAVAVEDCRICFLDLSYFKTILGKSAALQKELQQVYLNEIKQTERRLLQIAHLNVREKVADIMLHLAEAYNYHENGPSIRVHINREEMANLAGTTKEQVSKILSDLTKEDLIRFRAKQFQYFNIEGLKKIAAA